MHGEPEELQEKQGHFISSVLLLSLRTHILTFTGPRAKYFKYVCVCVCVQRWKGYCLLLQVANVGQGHIILEFNYNFDRLRP